MNRNIAIVEDEVEEAETLRSYFARYTQEYGTAFTVTHFLTAEAFLNRYRPVYDLVLMDICLPKTSGMDAAALLRRVDQSVPLIFVTNMAQFAVKGYEVDAFDFVVKPVSYANFVLKIHRLLGKLAARREGEVLVTQSDHMIRLPASQIKYIEISGHRMVYHTTGGDVNAYGNLREAEAGGTQRRGQIHPSAPFHRHLSARLRHGAGGRGGAADQPPPAQGLYPGP